MKLIRCGDTATVTGSPDDFVGTVFQTPIHSSPEPARAAATLVTFAPGARTNWHTHPLGQTLHVTSGSGWFQTDGESRVDIRAGDTVWIPPNERHWHGATDGTAMTHLAIHERHGDEGYVTWQEPVADRDFLGH